MQCGTVSIHCDDELSVLLFFVLLIVWLLVRTNYEQFTQDHKPEHHAAHGLPDRREAMTKVQVLKIVFITHLFHCKAMHIIFETIETGDDHFT